MRPLPTGCAGTGSICRITFCPVGAMAGGVASWAPRPLRTRGGAVWPPPACRQTTERQPCLIESDLVSSHSFISMFNKRSIIHQTISPLTVTFFLNILYPLCRSKPRQLPSSQQSFHRSTPGSSSCHRCHSYMDSHSEPPAIITKIHVNYKPTRQLTGDIDTQHNNDD